MRIINASINVDAKPYCIKKGVNYSDVIDAVCSAVQPAAGLTFAGKMAEGEKVSLTIELTLECLLNRRAPRRAPEVIAAEKAVRAAKAQKRKTEAAEWEEKQKQEKERLCLQRKQRITNQIDYAFRSGSESGTEPVSKFITCQQCDAPATFLHLNRAVPSGAAVLDESTVIGASCDEHTHNNPNYKNHFGIAEYFPVARLEFFYTGIRQIGIKR